MNGVPHSEEPTQNAPVAFSSAVFQRLLTHCFGFIACIYTLLVESHGSRQCCFQTQLTYSDKPLPVQH